MRLQWWSNAPWTPTGYGQQTAQVCKRLRAAGHDLSISANYGLQGAQFEWDDIPVYPSGSDAYSQDVIVAHWTDWAARSTEPTALFTLFDTWIIQNEHIGDVPLIASWVPIDHLPCPPDVLAWCERPNVFPIAMAKYGSNMLTIGGVEHAYVPHAIEPVFQPMPLLPSGRKARELMQVDDDAFVVMIAAANKGLVPCRKAFPEMFQAFKVFSERHRDAILYLHTDPKPGPGGVDLEDLAAACRIRPEQIRYVDPYAYQRGMGPDMLAAFYSTADVLLATSMGEGFGIPVIEAQACGTRVIVSDWTAQPELVGDGWTVFAQPWWDLAQKSWFATPIVPNVVEALEHAYMAERGPSAKAVEFAAGYSADLVFEQYWKPAIERIGDRLAEATK